MNELLTRTISGLVFAIIVIACIFISPWILAVLLLFVVGVGVYEMSRLHGLRQFGQVLSVEVIALGAYILGACAALEVISHRWLPFGLLFVSIPFLYALFTKAIRHETIFACNYASLAFLSLPSTLMLFMYRSDLFGIMAGPWLVMLVFCLLWMNDIFAYLTGSLLGRHKLFERISPAKTIEGSVGGFLFTLLAAVLYSHYSAWLSVYAAVGMAVYLTTPTVE